MITQRQTHEENSSDIPQETSASSADYLRAAGDYVASNPKAAVLLGLGVGFGAGIALASLFRETSRDNSLAERLGNQVMDSLGDVMPDSWKSYIRS